MPYKKKKDRKLCDKRRYKNNPRRKGQIRDSYLKRLCGLTFSEYERMCKEQKNLCFICGLLERKKIKNTICQLAVDHNHKTGKIRKLLCGSCNSLVSIFENYNKTKPQLLDRIKTYVKFYNEF